MQADLGHHIAESPASLEYGKSLLGRMKATLNFEPVIKTVMMESGISTRAEAESLLEAFLQWFALIPAVAADKGYVMLQSEVDEMFHAFILNTRTYREMCDLFFGRFIDHDPLDQPDGALPIHEYTEYTVDLLDEHYVDDLHPALRAWRPQVESLTYRISCLGECPGKGGMNVTGMARTPSNAPIIG